MNIHTVTLTLVGVSCGHTCTHIPGARRKHYFYQRDNAFQLRYTDDPEIKGEDVLPLAQCNSDIADLIHGMQGGQARILAQFTTQEEHETAKAAAEEEAKQREAHEKRRLELLAEATEAAQESTAAVAALEAGIVPPEEPAPEPTKPRKSRSPKIE